MEGRWKITLSEFLINLAAGWFGAVFISPNFTNIKGKLKLLVLISDLIIAIFLLWLGNELKK